MSDFYCENCEHSELIDDTVSINSEGFEVVCPFCKTSWWFKGEAIGHACPICYCEIPDKPKNYCMCKCHAENRELR